MLIGVTGPSGSSKTKIAKRLQKAHGFSRMHAGRPVKRMMRAGFGLTKEQTDGKLRDVPTMRLGGAAFRDGSEAVGKAVHDAMPHATSVEMVRRVQKRLAAGQSVVVDGVRSPVEAAAIRKMGGMIVRADDGSARGTDSSMPMDDMQWSVSPVDYTLDTSDENSIGAKCDAMVADMAKWSSDPSSTDLHKPRMPR